MPKINGGTTGKGFKPGSSGNPAGRPPKREDLKARCIEAVDDHVVEAWIKEVTTRGDEWVECSKLLTAYGYGKPKQDISVGGTDGGPLQIVVQMLGPEDE